MENYINKVIQGDCLIKLKELEDNSIDSIVTDPPAGISFMGKSWDTDKGGRDNWIKWMQEVATECKRVLKPGGHAFVWAIPRTSHWTATAWENAGFEIRDVVAHVFGSGFPKSLNIGKAVDKLQGNEREISGYKERFGREGRKANCGFKEEYVGASGTQDQSAMKPIMLPVSEEAKQWEGWGTALKPAREDWILMRKPLDKGLTIAENCLKYGTGGINIDESRVETDGTPRKGGATTNGNLGWKPSKEIYTNGRFPANLIHDNSEEVRGCFPESKTGSIKPYISKDDGMFGMMKGKEHYNSHEGDSGNASRFFKSIIYQAKASKSERNKGCDGLEEKAKVFNGQSDKPSEDMKDVEKRFTTLPKANNHPTVKPIALMEYLIKMVTPKGGTCLDPFSGSFSTGVACVRNGFGFIGIEREEEYVVIGKARLEQAQKEREDELKNVGLFQNL